MVTSRTGTRPSRWWGGNDFQATIGKKKWSFRDRQAGRFSASEKTLSQAPKCPKRRPGRFAGGEEYFSGHETKEKNFYFGNGSPAVSPKGENTFSSSEKLKNRNFANGKPAVSTVRTKRFQFPKPCNFTNSEPAVSPEARKRFLRREHFPTFRSLKNHFLATRDTSGFRTRSYHFWTFLRLKKPFFASVRKRPNFRRFKSGKSSVSETMKNGLCCSSR